MTRILLTIVFCAVVSPAVCAQNYFTKVTTKISRLNPDALLDEETYTGQLPVTASISQTQGGTIATADAMAGFNDLHVRSSSIATDSASTNLFASSVAEWNDRLFFKRNGQDITTGTIVVMYHVKGTIETQTSSFTPWLTASIGLGSSGAGSGFTSNGSHDRIFTTGPQARSWSASDGLTLRFLMSALAGNSATTLRTITDFTAGAQITNIVLLGANNQPDPTVAVTSSSGVIYTVPEPITLSLALWGIAIAALVRRRPA